MKTIDLAVIIPTLNEEHYIGGLLDSISSQTAVPREIVIVDAQSQDKTIEEIKKRQKKLPQLQFYQIPKYTISRQRNLGVNKTTASHILFLDADMHLKDKKTLANFFQEIMVKKPDVAVCKNLPVTDYWKDKLYFQGMHLLSKASRPFWLIVTSMNFYIRREVFVKSGGFDENVRVGEDMEFAQRLLKQGFVFTFLGGAKMYTSVRRFEQEGRRKFAFKMMRSFMNVQKYGFKDNPVDYKFGEFSK